MQMASSRSHVNSPRAGTTGGNSSRAGADTTRRSHSPLKTARGREASPASFTKKQTDSSTKKATGSSSEATSVASTKKGNKSISHNLSSTVGGQNSARGPDAGPGATHYTGSRGGSQPNTARGKEDFAKEPTQHFDRDAPPNSSRGKMHPSPLNSSRGGGNESERGRR